MHILKFSEYIEELEGIDFGAEYEHRYNTGDKIILAIAYIHYLKEAGHKAYEREELLPLLKVLEYTDETFKYLEMLRGREELPGQISLYDIEGGFEL